MTSPNASDEPTHGAGVAAEDTLEPNQLDQAQPHGSTPGARLGRYVVLEEIGQGGMGLVFSAYDPELNRKVALKLLRPNQGDRKRARSRLLLEAQTLAKLAHPNVITVYDVGTIGERVFVAMELIEGTTLKGWVAEAPRRWHEILEVFLAAGRGLGAAHAADLVHRDFKPENVLIGRDGRVRVMDFGLARPANSGIFDIAALAHGEVDETKSIDPDRERTDPQALDAPLLTHTGSIMGTPAYMAPEQHLGLPTDARSDQFSFCTALYQALYGEHPFAGEDIGALSVEKQNGNVRTAPSGAKVPSWLRRSLLRGLSPAPEDRFPNMDALLSELSKDPRVLRRKIMASVAVGSALLGTIGIVQYMKTLPPSVCRSSGDQLAQIWNDTRRTAVSTGLSRIELSFVPDTVALVTSTLDAYGEQWVSMHAEACETHARGEQSTSLLERRNLCLQDRLDELDALAAVLTNADAAVATKAGFAAMELQPIAQCAETEALTAEAEPPQDSATAEAVAATRRQLMRVRSLGDAGLVRDAVAEAEAAYARAQTITSATGESFGPIVAETRFRLGEAQALADAADDAKLNLSEAHWLAASLKHDVVAALVAGALVPVLGGSLRNPSEGLSWGRHAEAAFKRIHLAGRAEARLRYEMGLLFASEGDFASARDSLTTAQALFEQQPAGSWWLAAVHRALAELSLSQGRLADASDEVDRAQETFVAALGARHPGVALVTASAARLALMQGNVDASRALLQEAMAKIEEALGPSAVELLPLLRQRVDLELSQRRFDAAIEDLRRAHGITRDAWGDHPKVAQALFELGTALEQAGRDAEARQELNRALSLWERSRSKDHPDLAFALTSLGELDLRNGSYAQAVAQLERALKLRGGRGLDPQLLAHTQFALARALYVNNDRARARELAAKAREAFAHGKPPSPTRATQVESWLTDVSETLPGRPGPL